MAAPGQPEAGLRALDRALAATVGHKLFTVLVLNHAAGQNQRYYTSRPEAYPAGGQKPIDFSSEFYRTVVTAGRPRFLHDRADIVRALFDHKLVLSLGCEGAVNVPVRWNGRTLGGLNLLDAAGRYDEAQMPLLLTFAALAVPALLHITRNWTEVGP
ncbi:GAF domain-containing protein [Muricoccus roseus]|nr:GAF domain-containing protein [Roseomonas rosea]